MHLNLNYRFVTKLGPVLLLHMQALGPQVVRTLLIPHLEPFMSSSLFPAMADEPTAAAADSSSSSKDAQPQQQQQNGSSSAQEQQRKRVEQAQRQQQRSEAWQVYGALLSATGSAMYDLLIGQLQGEMPMHLLLARRSRRDMDWDSSLSKALAAAKRPGVTQDEAQQQQARQKQVQEADGVDAAAAAGSGAAADGAGAAAAAAAVNGMIAGSRGPNDAAAAAEAGSKDQPQHVQPRSLLGGGPAAAAARKRAAAGAGGSSSSKGGPGQQQQQQQPSIPEVLGESWKEDSDVNATLGALLHLFGEDLLPSLPLAQLAAVFI
jgi:hypothetical protein